MVKYIARLQWMDSFFVSKAIVLLRKFACRMSFYLTVISSFVLVRSGVSHLTKQDSKADYQIKIPHKRWYSAPHSANRNPSSYRSGINSYHNGCLELHLIHQKVFPTCRAENSVV